jgi:hypothetical protein
MTMSEWKSNSDPQRIVLLDIGYIPVFSNASLSIQRRRVSQTIHVVCLMVAFVNFENFIQYRIAMNDCQQAEWPILIRLQDTAQSTASHKTGQYDSAGP